MQTSHVVPAPHVYTLAAAPLPCVFTLTVCPPHVYTLVPPPALPLCTHWPYVAHPVLADAHRSQEWVFVCFPQDRARLGVCVLASVMPSIL